MVSFVASGPGIRLELRPVEIGQQLKRNFHFSGEGAFSFTARQVVNESTNEITGVIDHYVTQGLGGESSLILLPNGRYEVQRGEL